jgi:ATP-dependent DNA helicase DinG
MAEATARTLECDHGVLAVAAGTGTGKSFAYLVPAALSSKRVVVATATKALQDQLANKDLPLVAASRSGGSDGSGDRLTWAVLKGRSNYLCRQRLREIEEFGRQESLDGGSEAASAGRRHRAGVRPSRAATVGEQVVRLVEWATTTKSGDRAELDFEPEQQAWSNVSVTADECPGAHRCPMGADCFAERARARAALADVVVVNLHLLGADLRSGGLVLPEHDALVVDEAHELEDVLAASLGVEVSPGRLRGIASAARAALASSARRSKGDAAKADGVVDDVMSTATRFESALAAAGEQRLPEGLGDQVGPAAQLASTRLRGLESQLRSASGEERGLQGSWGSGSGVDTAPRPKGADQALRALLAVERCRAELERCLEAGASEVVWVAGGDRPSLRSAPLDVSSVMASQVFANRPVVLTSATMAPGLAARLGAPRDAVTELDVGSPFDYAHNGLIYCATRLPDRRQPGAEAAIHDEIELLVTAAGGRTLALFTSRRAMEQAADALRKRIEWPIHLQGELPKAALLQAFSAEEAACLFATMGFWQGVDVPGPTLSLVVIDRLPFPRPDDPLMAARRDAAGAGGFRAVDLPRAATLLAQGAGRLIRTATDRGVVAVLDPRLAKASYSGYLVKALPKMRRTRDRDEALAFLRALHA